VSQKFDVASVLERETDAAIAFWYALVEKNPSVVSVTLTRQDRCAHLPEMFLDLVSRLRNPLPLGSRALRSNAAHAHGFLRREQGYTAAMLVEESRMLQVTIFHILQTYIEETKSGLLLQYIMAIADEVDSQLAQAMTSYIAEANIDLEPVEA
jgi:hypothetical protein